MKKYLPIIILIGLFSWLLFDFINSPEEEQNADEQVGAEDTGLGKNELAPDFELMTLDGEVAKLSDYRGERVMLNFWATWCPPCRAEMPDMQNVYDQENFTILAINMTASELNEGVVKDFVDDYQLTFPILMDTDAAIVNLYQVNAYPTSYMIDSNGRVQFMVRGAMNEGQMIQLFNRLD